MKCPLCFEIVSSEELLQEHYLTTCAGLADLSDESVDDFQPDTMTKTKFQFISSELIADPEIFLLSTLPDTPQLTLSKVSTDLYQSEIMTVPRGDFEGQVVLGEEVLTVAPFNTNNSIITLHITSQELDAWSSKSSKRSSLSVSSVCSSTHSEDRSEVPKRRSLSADNSPAYSDKPTSSRSVESERIIKGDSTDSSLQASSMHCVEPYVREVVKLRTASGIWALPFAIFLHNRTSSKDSIEPREKRSVASKHWGRRRRRHKRAASTGSVSSTQDLCDNTLVNDELHKISGAAVFTEKEVQDLKAEISQLRIENRNQAKELNTLTKVIDGPVCPTTELGLLKRDNGDLKQELGELRNLMLKQERSHNKKIESNRGDPVDDWRKGQVEKLQKQVIEAERMMEEANVAKITLEEELSKAKEKISQLRETRDTLRNSMNSKGEDNKRQAIKLEEEITALHGKYMEQGKELAMIEGQSKICEELQIINDRLTGDNQELTQHNTMLTMQVAELKQQLDSLLINKNTPTEQDYKLKKEFQPLSPYKYKQRHHPLIATEEEDKHELYLPEEPKPEKREEITWDTIKDPAPPASRYTPQEPLTRYAPQEPLPTSRYTPTIDSTQRYVQTPVDTMRDLLHESPYKPREAVKDNRDLKPVNLATQYYNREPLKPAFVTTTEEDDTYKEALAIVEKYKRMDLEKEPQQVQEENKDVYTQWANGVKFESTPSRAGSNYSATDYTRDTRHNHTDTTHLPDSNMTGPTIEDSRYEIKSDNRIRGSHSVEKPDARSYKAWTQEPKPDTTKSYENSKSYDPRESSRSYKPQESKSYDPQDNKSYERTQSKSFEPREVTETKSYEPAPRNSPKSKYDMSKISEVRTSSRSYDTKDPKVYDSRYSRGEEVEKKNGGGYNYCGRSYSMDSVRPDISSVKAVPKDTSAEYQPRSTDSAECKRSIKPETVSEIPLNSRVVFKRGSDLERGTARYTGRLIGKDGQFVGVELNTNGGNHDGTFQGHTYFSCKPKRGVFVPLNKVQLVYPS